MSGTQVRIYKELADVIQNFSKKLRPVADKAEVTSPRLIINKEHQEITNSMVTETTKVKIAFGPLLKR